MEKPFYETKEGRRRRIDEHVSLSTYVQTKMFPLVALSKALEDSGANCEHAAAVIEALLNNLQAELKKLDKLFQEELQGLRIGVDCRGEEALSAEVGHGE